MKNTIKIFSLLVAGAGFVGCAPKRLHDGDFSMVRSLTGQSFTGKKYYLGWGNAGGSPENMENEVKYDVLHTHDIFTNGVGGNYIGQKLIGDDDTVNDRTIDGALDDIKTKAQPQDMYVQYSSGHGYPGGLGVGLDYDDLIERVLALNTKETIVFTMACFSGTEVDSFNKVKDKWKDYRSQGKTLFVMASSPSGQESSTGPGTDSEQQGPEGSAGSAFGHSLWKALNHSDGYYDGVKDGFISLAEIEAYTKALTQKIGGHMPVTTGVYYPGMIMNRVPANASSADDDNADSTGSSANDQSGDDSGDDN